LAEKSPMARQRVMIIFFMMLLFYLVYVHMTH
jgi:hypothetical protein